MDTEIVPSSIPNEPASSELFILCTLSHNCFELKLSRRTNYRAKLVVIIGAKDMGQMTALCTCNYNSDHRITLKSHLHSSSLDVYYRIDCKM